MLSDGWGNVLFSGKLAARWERRKEEAFEARVGKCILENRDCASCKMERREKDGDIEHRYFTTPIAGHENISS